MRCKVGNLLIDNKKFPVWVNNIIEDRLMHVIQIVCDAMDVDMIKNEFIARDYYLRWVGNKNNMGIYKMKERDNIMLELQILVDDNLAEIDFVKLDNFFNQIDKIFVVRRLEGNEHKR